MNLGLQGKKALITGASRGIGAGTAKGLALEGCDVILVARDRARLEGIKAEIDRFSMNADVKLIDFDMRADDAAVRLADLVGPVDILINNAGDIPAGGVLDIDDELWRRAWDLKVFGYINLTREYYREMSRLRRGVIVNVVGTAGERPSGNHIAVASGNAALIAFSRALGTDSVLHNVRVLAVNPGASETDRQLDRWKAKALKEFGDENRWQEYVSGHPFGRLADPEEVAAVIVFMASERASYVSGTAVTVDGGGRR